jgi:hypothetical protein
MNNDQIVVSIKDGGFIEIDERNGKALCRQILEVNVDKDGFSDRWITTIYPIHERYGRLHFNFSTKEKANGFLDMIYEACIDLDKMNSGLNTDTIVKIRVYNYG